MRLVAVLFRSGDLCRRAGLIACVSVAGLLTVALSGCFGGTEATQRRVENARGIGEIQRFTFDAPPRMALRWIGNDKVVYLTWSGYATVDLSTGAVTETPDASVTPPNPSPEPVRTTRLTPKASYGLWRVSSDSRFLYADESGDVRCGSLLVSPNQDLVACSYGAFDRLRDDTVDSGPAVIRLR